MTNHSTTLNYLTWVSETASLYKTNNQAIWVDCLTLFMRVPFEIILFFEDITTVIIHDRLVKCHLETVSTVEQGYDLLLTQMCACQEGRNQSFCFLPRIPRGQLRLQIRHDTVTSTDSIFVFR